MSTPGSVLVSGNGTIRRTILAGQERGACDSERGFRTVVADHGPKRRRKNLLLSGARMHTWT